MVCYGLWRQNSETVGTKNKQRNPSDFLPSHSKNNKINIIGEWKYYAERLRRKEWWLTSTLQAESASQVPHFALINLFIY